MTSATELPNGLEVHAAAAVLRVEALRRDLLRVRVSPNSHLPDDESWAVLSGRAHQAETVKHFSTDSAIGFDTESLHVRVERSPVRLVVEDQAGHVINEDAPGHPTEFVGERSAQGGEFRVWKTLRPDEHFFGLGDKTGPLDRRQQSFVDWNTDAFLFQESTDPIYKSIPFFLGESGGRYYGLYLDNTWRTSFDFGKETRGAYSFGADGGPLDYYLFYGPDPKQVVEAYAWLTGPAPLPPMWSLGYQQSRYSYAPENKLREVATKLRHDKIPADVLWLDIDYQDKNRPFTVDGVGFPDMPKLISDLKAMNFHVVAIADLHVPYLPNQGYAPYDTGAAGNHFVKNADGSLYIGESWPGKVVFPDYTQASTREWWGTNYRGFLGMGIEGFWNDMNEPSVRSEPTHTMPLTVQHRIEGPGFASRTTSHLEVHNIYGAQNARATFEGLERLEPNERPFVMTRSAFAGAQRYSVTWTGDNSSTWNHLRLTISMLENLGLSGYSFAGADVGGHVGSPEPDLLTKWMEVAAFQPIDRNHAAKSSKPQEVWVNGVEQEATARQFIDTRYRLMPYLYTLAEETSRTGLPMFRPLFLEFPEATADHHPIDLDGPDQFMLGSALLVAPPPYFEMQNKYSPILPGPVWYDFWTGERIGQTRTLREIAADGTEFSASTKLSPTVAQNTLHASDKGQPFKITASLAELPVFVRGGSILPMQPLVQSTDERPNGPLELRVYPGPNCAGTVYQDDGHTLNYKRGEYLRVSYSCSVTANGLELNFGRSEGSFHPWWNKVEVVVYGADPSWQISMGGNSLHGVFDPVAKATHVVIPESRENRTITFQEPIVK